MGKSAPTKGREGRRLLAGKQRFKQCRIKYLKTEFRNTVMRTEAQSTHFKTSMFLVNNTEFPINFEGRQENSIGHF